MNAPNPIHVFHKKDPHMATAAHNSKGSTGCLRSFIAPGAPATRTPCDGSESEMRVEFGFTPQWYHEYCGIDFGESWHLNPRYRRECTVKMCHELNRQFPELRLGGDNPDARAASLDGVHDATLVALLFGVPVEYYSQNWPAAKHKHLSDNDIRVLEPPDLDASPVFTQLMEQIDFIEKDWGHVPGYLNWQGVLNNAFRLRGQEIYADLLLNGPLMQRLFEVITHTMIEGMRRVYARQSAGGINNRHATVSNCLVNMVSPGQYAEFLMPWDQKIAEAFDCFGIHNCAWNVDPYIKDYASFEKLCYVDMGIESDLRRARELCPGARRAVMYKPTDLVNKTLSEIQVDLVRIRKELSPCDIVMADIDYGAPPDRVMAFAKLAEETLKIDPD